MKKVRLYVQIADWIPQEVMEEFARLMSENKTFHDLCQETIHEAMDSIELVGNESMADMEIGPGADVFEDI